MGSREVVLVTGGAGFIGSHLCAALIESGFQVRVLDNFTTGSLQNLQGMRDQIDLIRGDITNPHVLTDAVRDVSRVYHLAAQVDVARSIQDSIHTEQVNATGTKYMLDTSVEQGVDRFVYTSSAAIYGNPGSLPIKEDAPSQPISPYGASKLKGENYCRAPNLISELHTTILRYFNVYGARQTTGRYSGVITSFIERVSTEEPPIIYGDGKQTRDFVSVQDVVRATILATEKDVPCGETLNIGTGEPTTITQLAETVLELMGREDLEPVHSDPRPGDIRDSYADISKARTLLGFHPQIPLTEGLATLIRLSEKS